MEIQFFHYNKKAFNSFDEALQRKNGVVALGIFVFASSENNAQWSSLVGDLEHVQKPGLISSTRPFPIGEIMKEFNNYWYYHGSLTTPPCSNTVSWIISDQPVAISTEQVEHDRVLFKENATTEFSDLKPAQK